MGALFFGTQCTIRVRYKIRFVR